MLRRQVAEHHRAQRRPGRPPRTADPRLSSSNASAARSTTSSKSAPIASGAHDPQGHPELERVEPAGGLQALVDLVGDALLGHPCRVQVVGVVGGVAQRPPVADQQGAGADRLEERLVVVDGHRVGALDSVEQVPPASARRAARSRTRRRRAARPRRGALVGDRPAAGRSCRSRSYRPWRRRPSRYSAAVAAAGQLAGQCGRLTSGRGRSHGHRTPRPGPGRAAWPTSAR